jgi:hypothetical protein
MSESIEHAFRIDNRRRLERLSEWELRDVVAWLNGADPELLRDILNDLDDEWGA